MFLRKSGKAAIRPFSIGVDQSEMDTFSRIHDWWSPRGSMMALHAYNKERAMFIREVLGDLYTLKPFEGKKILDIGCGAGLLSESLARLGGNVRGIDANENSIKCAQKHLDTCSPNLKENLQYLKITTSELLDKHPDERHDMVMAMEVIEHVGSVPQFLSEIEHLLKKECLLFISTMNKTPLAYLTTIFMAEYVLRMVPQGTHTYSKYITPPTLIEECSRLGLTHLRTQGFLYDPICNKMRRDDTNLVNYISAFRKL